MMVCRQFVVFCVILLLAGSGCERKKTSQIPAQAKNPAEPIPSPLPSQISEEAPAPAPAPPQQPTEAKSEEPKQPPKRRKPRKPPAQTPVTAQSTAPPAPAPAAPSTNTLAVAHPPANPAEAPADTAIAADVSRAQLTQQKQNTAQLLDSTEKTLGGLHNLSQEQDQLVTQIRMYVAQSKKATTEGDFERAFNLATKAHLLTDALVKQ
jgi:hypothetical protein